MKEKHVKKMTAMYQILIGTGMIGIWVLLFSTGNIPELQNELMRIVMHITAEVLTGVLLLISGLWILIKKHTHRVFYYLSSGALLYTLIASPGYYAGKDEWAVFFAFIGLLLFTIFLLIINQKNDIT